MAASQTTIPAVQAKLLALFKAAVSEPTEVWGNRPNEDHQLAENVYLGDVKGRREFKLISGGEVAPNSRQEDYEVLVEVEVYRQGTDSEGTEARMWELVQALETSVAERPTLEGLAHVQWAISANFEQSTKVMTDGVLAQYIFGVSVTARI